MSGRLMIVPSLGCPASCKYCFGPHEGGQAMSAEVVEAVARWQGQYEGKLEITFHGGEPLAAGAAFYRHALPALKEGLSGRRVRFSLQSNLWLLDDELCRLFREYRVSIGTSLDGPEHVTDAQRGAGYFRRTMAGIDLARSHGLNVGCICTFTPQSLDRLDAIFAFFAGNGLDFSVHACLPSLRHPEAGGWALTPEQHGQLLSDALDLYMAKQDWIRVSTLDSMCRGVATGRGGLCTFDDCLGGYLAIGPGGDIYPCQRFAGMPEYAMGNVLSAPAPDEIRGSRVWRMFRDREERIRGACGACAYVGLCRGGCPYNALVAGGGRFGDLRDPHCVAYRRAFRRITDLALEDVFSEANLREVVERPLPEQGLLRQGRLAPIMRGRAHPRDTARHARRILAAVALAATGSPAGATERLQRLGLLPDDPRSLAAVEGMYRHLTSVPGGYNNIYLHVTFDCNLRCTHCYADAGDRPGALPVEELIRVCRDAARLGFRHAVITGGEPLVHPDRDRMLDGLAAIREDVKPMLTVLRTNLAVEAGDQLLRRVGRSTDEVVVSVDGVRETHDARRGKGSYDATVRNLRALRAAGGDADVSLAAVLPMQLVNGAPGASVGELAKELGIRRTRFRPLLPLGRAACSEPDVVPETMWGHVDPATMIEYGFTPASTCGIGRNLYVEPDGNAYPCYAWHGRQWYLGSVLDGGLEPLLRSDAFRSLGRHTVDTNRKCGGCMLRYLCGGACRGWNRQPQEAQTDLDAAPADCSPLYRRAGSLLASAMDRLGVPRDRWLGVGLPLP